MILKEKYAVSDENGRRSGDYDVTTAYPDRWNAPGSKIAFRKSKPYNKRKRRYLPVGDRFCRTWETVIMPADTSFNYGQTSLNEPGTGHMPRRTIAYRAFS